ncbi:21625_t:CDS:2, partial [Gigaspora margarita]
ADAHENYVENSLLKNPGNAFVLNVDDYHNIHVPQQADSTSTSRPAHMATIIANPCPILAILRNGALNSKIIDDKLIMKHLDERFIINLGIPYNEHRLGRTGDRHIQNTILFDFVEGNLKSVEDYTNALRI